MVFPLLFGILAFLAAWFIIGILLCVWVYRDAQRRGMNGVLWLIVTLIAGIIGLIIYLIAKKEPSGPAPPPTPSPYLPKTRFCPSCGRGVPPNDKFCPNCGKPMPE
jgi:rubredoxin